MKADLQQASIARLYWPAVLTGRRFSAPSVYLALQRRCSSLALVAVSPYFLYQAMRYRSTSAASASGSATCRSRSTSTASESIWIHAVSVGEVLTARALARRAAGALPAPAALPLDDDDGRAAGRAAQPAGRRRRLLLPVRLRRSSSAATLRLVRPRLFVMMETEIWPNLLRECRRRGVKTMLVNGRISSRSYPALPAGPAVLPARARRRRSLLHAERRVGAPHRRRSAPTRRGSPSPAA